MMLLSFEVKLMATKALYWLMGLLFVTALMMGLYPAFRESEEAVMEILTAYPPAVLKAFGMELSTLFTFEGFFGFTSPFVLLVGATMAFYFGVVIFGREKREKNGDFLYTRPITRGRIFMEKLLAGFLLLSVQMIVFGVVSFLLFTMMADTESSSALFMASLLTLCIGMLLFYCFGAGCGIFLRRIKYPSSLASGAVFGCYILSIIVNLLDKAILTYLSPFHYFETSVIAEKGTLSLDYMAIALLLSLGILAFSKYNHGKADVKGV